MRTKAWWLRSAGLALTATLTACGGSGGGGVASTPPPITTPAPTPTPTPTPTPAPTPAPTPTSYDTSEYRATVGAVSMNALAAYNRNATGAGIAIGIVDSGLDMASTDFGSRISPASQDVAGNANYDDVDGHGTAVAFTAAGQRNGVGTHGVAFDATVIALRADRPGTCSSTSTDDTESSCKFPTDAIGRGVDAARVAGARVINLSLGGGAMPADLMAAIGRATAAGIVIVIAAGNDSTVNPDPFAEVANTASVARNEVIIAGSVDATDTLSSFSDKAGDGAAHYLAAVGEKVRAPCNDTQVCLWSGTSLAAPQISGAVALLAQAFPNLTGAQIVSLLFQTARDPGAAGVDSTYGNGVIDLTRAFQPVGTTSVAGSRTVVSTTGNGTLSAPMGDASQTGLGAVILDGYDRAFAIDLAQTLRRTGPQRTFTGILQSTQRTVAMAGGGMTVALTLAPRSNGDIGIEGARLSTQDAQVARAVAGSVTQRIGSGATFGFAFAQGSGALTAQLTGQAAPAFLVARDDGMGFDTAASGASAIRQQIGRFGITAAAESGAVLTQRDAALGAFEHYQRGGYARYTLGIDRRFGGLATLVSATRLDERDTLLGARFDEGLGAAHGGSWFVDGSARWDGGRGWSVGGTMRQGWTRATIGGGLNGGGLVRTDAFAADIDKDGVFGSDSAGVRIAQPLRVASGGIDLGLPTNYDYASTTVTGWTTQRLNLAPQGRELDVEARYARALGPGAVQTNLFWRRDPGNFAALPNDYGLALRYSLGF